MDGQGGWFRRIAARLRGGLRRFMEGRHGTDRLTLAILCVGAALSLVGVLVQLFGAWSPTWNAVLTLISYALMVLAVYRTLSRDTYRRYRENQWFCQLLDRLKDRKNRHFKCPKCRQIMRVPRGSGKVTITCTKCGEKFDRKA